MISKERIHKRMPDLCLRRQCQICIAPHQIAVKQLILQVDNVIQNGVQNVWFLHHQAKYHWHERLPLASKFHHHTCASQPTLQEFDRETLEQLYQPLD